MKKIIQSLFAATALAAICFTSSSFSSPKGGEGFEIFLDNQLLIQHFGSKINEPTKLVLDPRFPNDQLTIKYYHCGQVGKSRDITIKDGQNRILKEWQFGDGSATSAEMNCPVRDILALQKVTPGNLNLYYSSTELPNGRLLTSIAVKGGAVEP